MGIGVRVLESWRRALDHFGMLAYMFKPPSFQRSLRLPFCQFGGCCGTGARTDGRTAREGGLFFP